MSGKIFKLVQYTLAILAFVGVAHSQTITFTPSNLAGESVNKPTALQFGPDGRLYVAQQDGKIFAYTVVRNAPNNYSITATETITLIQQIPNHNDDGSLIASVNTRQVTGILVVGTAANPVLYVTSSDPRIGGGFNGIGNDKNLDTNSGVVSRLTKNGGNWTKTDLVRGLPRSEENHSTNGMQLDAVNNILYVCQGGNTNMGAPSNNFVFLPEYAYAATILKVDLNVIGNSTYDLPTLDDEDRANVNPTPGFTDNNDPFGGNSGKNQAKLDPTGPVQIYSTGWRNQYDLVITQNGRMYSFDNGPNTGWGGATPDCSNTPVDPGSFYCDVLHFVPGQGYYAGHPNPTRANRNNTFNPTNPQTPIPAGMENPQECQYIPAGQEAYALTTICSSTNGMCEYKASNFSSALKGDLLAAAFNGKIYRFKLNAAGDAIVSGGQTTFASNFGSTPLDVTAQADNEIFPGTVWSVTYGASDITVFEPSDYQESNPALIAFNNADKIRGGRMFDKFWASETGFTAPVDPTIDMNNVLNFSEFYSCKSCHAWDQKGNKGAFIDRPALVNRPKVTGVNLFTRVPQMTIQELFDKVKHTGGSLVDPARTADGTNATLGGNRMPDYGKLLTDNQIWDIVKFLKEGALNTEQLYDLTTAGTYPTGTKTFSSIGKDGDAAAGLTFFNLKCKNCHGANGRDGSLPNGQGGFINDDIGMSIGEFARKQPYEIQHKAVHGELGTIMHGVTTANINDIKNLLKALADKNNFPDLHPVWYRDVDGDGYGIPTDSSLALNKPVGYTADKTDCDDTRATVHPNATEIRDGLDNDCDGEIDEGVIVWAMNLNAGGAQYISPTLDTFRADTYFTTPSTAYVTTYTGDILNTTDDVLFKTERYGNFSYNIPVPSAGTYEVRLQFVETFSRNLANGKRVFHVDLEGARVLSNFDIYAAAGAYTAITKTFSTIVGDGTLNIQFTSVVNNAKISAISVVQVSDLEQVYNASDALNGGRLYSMFWSVETDFVSPVDASIDMTHITNFPEFYRCKSCHGWDQKGNIGAYIDRAPKVDRPSVAGEIISFSKNNSVFDVFSKIKHTGGAAVNPARTADGTNASLGGNAHPDYGKILNDEQILDIVKFLKEKAFDTEQLYDIATTGVYPTGTKSFSNLGKDGDAAAGSLFYANNCAACHGGNGRDEAYFIGLSIGEIARTRPHQVQHIAVYGNPGTSMYGVGEATVTDIKNMLKALSNQDAYPNLHLTFFADADGDGYGNPNDSLIDAGLPVGYVRNKLDCDDTRAAVNPTATEIPDGLDNNCDGQIDEGFSTSLPSVFINTGGTQYIAASGDTFRADAYYSTPSYTFKNTGLADIANTTDDYLYKYERNGTTLNYAIPVANGEYTVRLHFAEIYFGTPGKSGGAGSRVFDVSLEGNLVLDNYDIFADAGGAAKAVIKEFSNISVTDGFVNINMTAIANRAKISAISIIPKTGSVTLDCNGDANGTALIDDCGICAGGNTGKTANANKDCNGVCFGSAFVNACGICVGGNTGADVNAGKDCNGVCGGSAALDDCGICSGGNTGNIPNAAKDCNGVCFGSAVPDDCGVCGGNNSTCGCNPLDVVSLTLVHSGTAGEIGALTNGMVLNKSQLGAFSIRADVCDGNVVKSVQFKLNNTVYRTENEAPYAINGDKAGSFNAWNPAVGTYTLKVTGYSAKGAAGTAGAALTITFEVVAYSYKMDENVLPETVTEISVYPNPSDGNFDVETNLVERGDFVIEVYSQLGQIVYRHEEKGYLGEARHHVELNQPSGIYMMRIKTGGTWHTRQMAVK